MFLPRMATNVHQPAAPVRGPVSPRQASMWCCHYHSDRCAAVLLCRDELIETLEAPHTCWGPSLVKLLCEPQDLCSPPVLMSQRRAWNRVCLLA